MQKGLSKFEEMLAQQHKKKPKKKNKKKREEEERLQPMQADQRQTSSVPFATGTVIPALDWTATPDVVPE